MAGTIDKISFYIEWKIPEFSSLPTEADKDVCSPPFSFLGESWFLMLFPNGSKKNDSVGYISLFLWRKSSGPPIDLDYSLGFKTVEGKKECAFGSKERKFEENMSYGSFFMKLRSELLERHSEFLPLNVLTVFCSLKYSKPDDASSIDLSKCSDCKTVVKAPDNSFYDQKILNEPVKCLDRECQTEIPKDQLCISGSAVDNHESKVLIDFKEWFHKKDDCDVIIKVKQQEFPAHRSILQARSSVFAATFRNEMKEKATGILEIEDCDPSSFSEFLCFLYCGSANISVENVFSLYATTDKYDVQDLKAKCLMFMKENLSVDTFCDTIILALKYSERELIKFTTDFFIKNAPKIVVTVKWQAFSAENPTYSNELIVKLLVPDTRVQPNISVSK